MSDRPNASEKENNHQFVPNILNDVSNLFHDAEQAVRQAPKAIVDSAKVVVDVASSLVPWNNGLNVPNLVVDAGKVYQDAGQALGRVPKAFVDTNRLGMDVVNGAVHLDVSAKEAPNIFHDHEILDPITPASQQMLSRDADLFKPVQNKDGSTTYSLLQIGMTDRDCPDGVHYYKRKVDVTLPAGAKNIKEEYIKVNDRQPVSQDEFKNLLKREQSQNSKIDLYTHGVFTPDDSADKQALELALSSGRPTIAIDWTADPGQQGNPLAMADQYLTDTDAAKRATNNREFMAAIDNTIQQIAPENTGMIGFSHGCMFDTRYFNHRVNKHLPPLDVVILNHPDVPIGASELLVNNKPDTLRDAAKHSFVIGGQKDNLLKIADFLGYLPIGATFEDGRVEERLGTDSARARQMIEAEGATPISEDDDKNVSSHHWLNFVGINELLQHPEKQPKDNQTAFNQITDSVRQSVA